jgi:hypothetical protein
MRGFLFVLCVSYDIRLVLLLERAARMLRVGGCDVMGCASCHGAAVVVIR